MTKSVQLSYDVDVKLLDHNDLMDTANLLDRLLSRFTANVC